MLITWREEALRCPVAIHRANNSLRGSTDDDEIEHKVEISSQVWRQTKQKRLKAAEQSCPARSGQGACAWRQRRQMAEDRAKS